VMSSEDETRLVEYIKGMATRGTALERHQIIEKANAMVRARTQEDSNLGVDWFRMFQNRHKNEISKRRLQGLEAKRAYMVNPETMNDYMDTLEDVQNQHPNLTDDRKWNLDETGFTMDTSPTTSYCARGAKDSHTRTTGNREHVRVLACGSAAGRALPSHLIFTGQRLATNVMENTPPGATCSTQGERGWSE
jgi:hypothetical protein